MAGRSGHADSGKPSATVVRRCFAAVRPGCASGGRARSSRTCHHLVARRRVLNLRRGTPAGGVYPRRQGLRAAAQKPVRPNWVERVDPHRSSKGVFESTGRGGGMADAADLNSAAARHRGSNPLPGTNSRAKIRVRCPVKSGVTAASRAGSSSPRPRGAHDRACGSDRAVHHRGRLVPGAMTVPGNAAPAIGDRTLSLEVYETACAGFAQAVKSGSRSEPPNWLPDVDSNHEHRG